MAFEDFFQMLDDALIALGDAHTRLYYFQKKSTIYMEPFEWKNRKLYVLLGKDICEVKKINDIDVQKLRNEYIKKFVGFPVVLIENEFLKNLKTGIDCFKGTTLKLEIRKNLTESIVIISPVLLEQIIEKMPKGEKRSLQSFYVYRFNNSLIVKILTFRDELLVDKIKNELQEKAGDIESVIFDIRDNNGGYIEIAKELCDKILPNKVILDYEIKDSNGNIFPKHCVGGDQWEFLSAKKIMGFVNKRTMSSAEYIFAYAVKMNGCLLVGEKTAGHPNQAGVYSLQDNSVLQVTQKRYFKNGKLISDGIEPDVFIEPQLFEAEMGRDTCLEWLKRRNGAV